MVGRVVSKVSKAAKEAQEATGKVIGRTRGRTSRLSELKGKSKAELQKRINSLEAEIERKEGQEEGRVEAALRLELEDTKDALNKLRKEDSDEVGKVTRNMTQKKSDKKFAGYTPSSPFNRGGMASRKGNFDMRKGGMFMKGSK